jgi:hypothetical protein
MTSRLVDWETLLASIDMMELSGRERGRTKEEKKYKTSNCDCPTGRREKVSMGKAKVMNVKRLGNEKLAKEW